jgi:hypothetical protein
VLPRMETSPLAKSPEPHAAHAISADECAAECDVARADRSADEALRSQGSLAGVSWSLALRVTRQPWRVGIVALDIVALSACISTSLFWRSISERRGPVKYVVTPSSPLLPGLAASFTRAAPADAQARSPNVSGERPALSLSPFSDIRSDVQHGLTPRHTVRYSRRAAWRIRRHSGTTAHRLAS